MKRTADSPSRTNGSATSPGISGSLAAVPRKLRRSRAVSTYGPGHVQGRGGCSSRISCRNQGWSASVKGSVSGSQR